MMKVFGVYEEDIGPSSTQGAGSQVNLEDAIAPYVNALAQFRDKIKQAAEQNQPVKDLFKLCDSLRDDVLPTLGVRLEDRAKGQEAVWKYEDKEVLLKEKEAKAQEKLRKEEEKRAKAELELKKKSTPPQDWFRVMFSDKYSQFDADGLPTHDIAGKEVNEQIRNKLRKE